MKPELARRLEAWREFERWEAAHRRPAPSFEEAVRWLGHALAIARAAGDLPERSIEEKVARVAEMKRRLSRVPSTR